MPAGAAELLKIYATLEYAARNLLGKLYPQGWSASAEQRATGHLLVGQRHLHVSMCARVRQQVVLSPLSHRLIGATKLQATGTHG